MSIATDVLWHIMSCEQTYSNLRYLVDAHHDQYLGWLIASLSPWAGRMFEGVDAKKNIPAAATAAREGLKIPTKLYNTIIKSYKNYDMIQETVQKLSEGIMMSRGLTGMFVRRLGADWKIQYLCAMLLEIIWVWEEGSTSPSPKAEEIIQKYSKFLHRVEDLGLLQAYTFKPVLNVRLTQWSALSALTFVQGKEMMVVLGQKEARPWMMGALNALMEWQLDNPEEDRGTAETWVRGSRDRLLQST
jgi:tRNA nucleotidyltransferase (CCA-adding enzyme)